MNTCKVTLVLLMSIASITYVNANSPSDKSTNATSEKIKESRYLTSEEITILFSSSTMTGIFQGKPFGQRNHANGLAVLAMQGDEVRLLPWFTEPDGVYCEDWGRDGVLRFKLRTTETADHYLIESAGGENTLKIVRELTNENFD